MRVGVGDMARCALFGLLLAAGACAPVDPPLDPDIARVRITASGDREAVVRAAAQAFLSDHDDVFDVVVLWPDPRIFLPSQFFLRMRNDVAGLGLPPILGDAEVHSERLIGVIAMGHDWISVDPTGKHDGARPPLGGGNDVATIARPEIHDDVAG